jgi:hypothetical protein
MIARGGAGPAAAMSLAPTTPVSAQRAFDAVLGERARRASKSASWRLARPTGPSGTGIRASIAAAAVPSLGSLRGFHALTGSGLQNFSYTIATARLSYIGSNVLLYVDTLAPANGFTPTQMQSFGQYFDQVLYGLDVTAFGPPSDIDGNGRIIMLLSPTVNALSPRAQCSTEGFVAGYFDGTDFTSGPNSNQGEIFYSVVPDPGGTVSCSHSVDDLLKTVPATFLHELQHLISFSQHVVIHGGDAEEGWLDEGLSIRAEELGSEYFEAKYPPPSGRTNPAQLFPDSSQGFVAGLLPDSYTYLLRADTASLTLHDDSENGFSWRGGDWLLVHWLGDLKGKSIFTTLDQSRSTGIANISAAAGESFGSLFGDFSLAMWTDSLAGVPRSAVPARDRLQTRNLRQIYQRLFVTNNGNPSVPRAYPVLTTTLSSGAGLVTANMVPGTMAFYILDLTASNSSVAIQFSGPGGAAFPSSLGPQVSIYHLP